MSSPLFDGDGESLRRYGARLAAKGKEGCVPRLLRDAFSLPAFEEQHRERSDPKVDERLALVRHVRPCDERKEEGRKEGENVSCGQPAARRRVGRTRPTPMPKGASNGKRDRSRNEPSSGKRWPKPEGPRNETRGPSRKRHRAESATRASPDLHPDARPLRSPPPPPSLSLSRDGHLSQRRSPRHPKPSPSPLASQNRPPFSSAPKCLPTMQCQVGSNSSSNCFLMYAATSRSIVWRSMACGEKRRREVGEAARSHRQGASEGEWGGEERGRG